MNCQNCGAQLEDGAKFCEFCGTPVVGQDVAQPVIQQDAAAVPAAADPVAGAAAVPAAGMPGAADPALQQAAPAQAQPSAAEIAAGYQQAAQPVQPAAQQPMAQPIAQQQPVAQPIAQQQPVAQPVSQQPTMQQPAAQADVQQPFAGQAQQAGTQQIPVQQAQPGMQQPTQQVPAPAPAPMNQGGAPQQPYAPYPPQGGDPNMPNPYGAGQEPPKKKVKGWVIALIVAIAVVVIAGVVIGVVVLNSNNTPEPVEVDSPVDNATEEEEDVVEPEPEEEDDGDEVQLIEGEVLGEVGVEYETRWFTFEVESLKVTNSYGDYTALDGYTLMVARITETNISGSEQPFGTFDWFIAGTQTAEGEGIYPLEPFSDNMMPDSFYLDDGETATYDVVIEIPKDLEKPYLKYVELSSGGTVYSTFMIPVK